MCNAYVNVDLGVDAELLCMPCSERAGHTPTQINTEIANQQGVRRMWTALMAVLCSPQRAAPVLLRDAPAFLPKSASALWPLGGVRRVVKAARGAVMGGLDMHIIAIDGGGLGVWLAGYFWGVLVRG